MRTATRRYSLVVVRACAGACVSLSSNVSSVTPALHPHVVTTRTRGRTQEIRRKYLQKRVHGTSAHRCSSWGWQVLLGSDAGVQLPEGHRSGYQHLFDATIHAREPGGVGRARGLAGSRHQPVHACVPVCHGTVIPMNRHFCTVAVVIAMHCSVACLRRVAPPFAGCTQQVARCVHR